MATNTGFSNMKSAKASVEQDIDIDVIRVIESGSINMVRFLIIVLCTCVTLVEGFDIQAMGFIAPSVAKDWEIALSGFGFVFSASIVGMLVGGPVAGLIGDRYGRKLGLVSGLFLAGISMVFCANANTIEGLMLCRFVTGVGLGVTTPNVVALVTEYSPARIRATVITVMVSGFTLGAVIGGFIVSRMLEIYGWRDVVLWGGILPLMIIPLVWFALPESIMYLIRQNAKKEKISRLLSMVSNDYQPQSAHKYFLKEAPLKKSSFSGLFASGRSRGTLLLWLLMSLTVAMNYFFINWLPSILRIGGFDASQSVLGSVLFNMAGVVGAIVLARIIDLRGSKVVMCAAYLLAALTMVCLSFSSMIPPQGILFLVAIAGVAISGSQNVLVSMISGYYPSSMRATGIGLASAVGRLGTIAGLITGGFVLAMPNGVSMTFIGLAVAGAFSSVLVWNFGKQVDNAR